MSSTFSVEILNAGSCDLGIKVADTFEDSLFYQLYESICLDSFYFQIAYFLLFIQFGNFCK